MPNPASTALSRPSVESKVIASRSFFTSHPGFFQCLLDNPPRPRTQLPGHQRGLRQLLYVDLLVRPFMPRRDHAHHVVFHEGFHLNIPAHRRPLDQAQLHSMLHQRFQDGLCIATHHADLDLGIFLQKSRDQLGQQVLPDGLGRAQRQPPGVVAGCGGDSFTSLFSERGKPSRQRATS